ncbi:MAG: PaaI family thioesterase [Porticoccaceae bacterium]|nr:PaaI family thioesterase [Pseudomonadales bacterium]MCP5172275.1 PaaI family thioesterase [Pseudomonadales bacterium]
MMTDNLQIPTGFSPMKLEKGFNQQFGQMYSKEDEGGLILAFRVGDHHLNPVGTLHGGAIATFADFQVIPASRLAGVDTHSPTITLTTDYLAPGKEGDWVELHVRLQKRTGTMLFTAGEMWVEGNIIARTTGIYRVMARA